MGTNLSCQEKLDHFSPLASDDFFLCVFLNVLKPPNALPKTNINSDKSPIQKDRIVSQPQ